MCQIVFVAFFWLAVWQILSLMVHQVILLPSPLETLKTLVRLAGTGRFWASVGKSMLRICAGFLIGTLAGVVGAMATSRFRILQLFLSPLLHLVRSVPVASFIILALVWIQTGYLPVFISFLMVLPVVWNSVETAIRAIDPKLLEMAHVLHMTPRRIFWEIKMPAVLPSLWGAALTSLGLAWKSGIAAEVICRPSASLGGMLQDAKIYLETPEVFALTVTIVLLSLMLESLLKGLTRRLQRHDSV